MAAKTNTKQAGGGQWREYNARITTIAAWLRDAGYSAESTDFDFEPFVARVLSTWEYYGHNDRAAALVERAAQLTRGEKVFGVNGGRPKRGSARKVMSDLARIVEQSEKLKTSMRLVGGARMSEIKKLTSVIDEIAETYELEPAE